MTSSHELQGKGLEFILERQQGAMSKVTEDLLGCYATAQEVRSQGRSVCMVGLGSSGCSCARPQLRSWDVAKVEMLESQVQEARLKCSQEIGQRLVTFDDLLIEIYH